MSPLYETEPLGPAQPDFLNAAYRVRTDLDPLALLDVLLRVERRLGRDRSTAERWGPRSLDLDFLWDAQGAFDDDGLHVPHAELEHRRFAMTPMLAVAPELNERYAGALAAAGGALSPWDRAAVRTSCIEADRHEIHVEADSLADACASCTIAADPLGLLETTRDRVIDSSVSAFADALRQLSAAGFTTHHATISDCSDTQWVAHFHGANTGVPRGDDVRLQTTLGASRAFSARLSRQVALG